ncbi:MULTISPECIES: MATE family efflux transporter [unclassified Romboutsia]|uniref:MATE family efflux transporter n=1 Tax=unclassified Romboutsia TaxID=2626894 RepID=UPI000F07063A|nr:MULTISPECIES: MATE family efflux transporter [unclassified Romboutsia]
MESLDLLKGNEKRVFYHYLIPSICSTLVTSIYILVDTLIIGQGVGADGILALNIFLPFYSIYMGIGLLFGIGSGILMSVEDGIGNTEKSNEYFINSVLSVGLVAIILTILSILNLREISYFLGANESSIDLVMEYGKYIVYATPIFICTNFLGPIIRNRKEPNLCMIGVLIGAGLNIVLDYLFVFPMQMGMKGAAIATVIGSLTTSLVLLTHFIKKKNRVKISIKVLSLSMIKKIVLCGGSNFLMEVASGFVIFIFNIQILKYIGDNGIVVYGIISNCVLVGIALFNGVAQASQPVISTNYGANEKKRVDNVLKYAMYTTIAIGSILFFIVFVFTKEVILVFVNANSDVINIGIPAIRMYLSAFCIMNINILVCNYLQSVGREKLSVKISIVRGFLLNVILIFVMPILFGGSSLWLVVPITELVTFIGIGIYSNKINFLKVTTK